jgi:hypothetical protein
MSDFRPQRVVGPTRAGFIFSPPVHGPPFLGPKIVQFVPPPPPTDSQNAAASPHGSFLAPVLSDPFSFVRSSAHRDVPFRSTSTINKVFCNQRSLSCRNSHRLRFSDTYPHPSFFSYPGQPHKGTGELLTPFFGLCVSRSMPTAFVIRTLVELSLSDSDKMVNPICAACYPFSPSLPDP